MATSKQTKFEALKKLFPLIKKEEGDVLNQQLAKEVAERGAQLDNPTFAEQLKNIQLPEEKVIKLPQEEYFSPPDLKPTPGGALGDVIPEYKVQQHDLNLGEIIPEGKPNPEGWKSSNDANLGTLAKFQKMPDVRPSRPPLIDNGSPELTGDFFNVSNLDDKLKNADLTHPESLKAKLQQYQEMVAANKGKIAAGAGLAGLAAMNSGNGEIQALKQGASTESPNATAPSKVDVPETEQEKLIKREIQKLSVPSAIERQTASDQPTVVDFGSAPSIASLERLQQLQNEANEQSKWSRFAQAFSQARAGMSGQAEDRFSKGYDEDIKASQAIPQQYLQQVQFEKEDPNSAVSQGYRSLAKAYNFDVQGNASAADIERQLPQFANVFNQRMAQKERREMAAENRAAKLQEMQMRLAGTQDIKKDKQKIKALDDYSKTADKEYLSLKKMENAVASMSYNDFEKGGPQDVAALYSFIRALDPESVVREGEIALARAGMSWPQQLKGAVLNRSQGGMMDPSYRKQMFTIAKHMAERGTAQYNELLMGKRERLKKSFGASDEEIEMVDPYLFRQKTRENTKAPPSGPVGKSGLDPEQRKARIEELKAKKAMEQ
jgi:hypothetical protein